MAYQRNPGRDQMYILPTGKGDGSGPYDQPGMTLQEYYIRQKSVVESYKKFCQVPGCAQPMYPVLIGDTCYNCLLERYNRLKLQVNQYRTKVKTYGMVYDMNSKTVFDIDPETLGVISEPYTLDVYSERISQNTLYIELNRYNHIQETLKTMSSIEHIWSVSGIDNDVSEGNTQ